MKSMRIFLPTLVIIGVGLLLTKNMWVPKVVSKIEPMLVSKVKILEKEPDRDVFGGLGNNNGPIGCTSNLWVEKTSSLSFECGSTSEFKDWVFVFNYLNNNYACPGNTFSIAQCLLCRECSSKIDRLMDLDLSSLATTSDWKLYENKNYRFKFQYPADWRVEVIPDYIAGKINTGPREAIIFTDPNFNRMVVVPYGNEPDLPVGKLIESREFEFFHGPTGVWRKFGDEKGTFAIVVNNISRSSEYHEYLRFFYILIVPVNAEYLDEQMIPLFETILLTFRF